MGLIASHGRARAPGVDMRKKVDGRPSPHGSDGTHHANLVTQVEDKALVSYAGQVVMEAERAASTEGIISCNTHFLHE
jgi:hypothetical protein